MIATTQSLLLVAKKFFRIALGAIALVACSDEGPPELPSAEVAAERYSGDVSGEIRGNLLELRVAVGEQLLRGGPIWERSGPYFYLFSGDTRDLFTEYPDLAGVRVIAEGPDGEELSRATLSRGELSPNRWQHAIALAARAQQEGTESPRQIEELIFFGEEFTDYSYRDEDDSR